MAGIQTYTIAGRQVASHYLAMGVLGAMFGGAYWATSGPKKPSTPPMNATSSEEADFITKFMENQAKKQ
ncbi:hypothetical protein E4U30_000623 [Claviceps sp. LM220 group G6]|nr:hypothetical protein E4U15_002069 [Claviceps sp. LM218 group G6]KAG6097435.1 hypothetical protein E4U30_000623 [Claviceps sp. LM220 group G6]KAG6114494.1 hypothetical protein E4U31_003833 [Claviceps sp. LM219 group G6]